jgi:SAM-dependent methyltransferase
VAVNTGLPPAVVWHDLECGSYRADLPLWLELARSDPGGPVLDVGAGTGRVALELAGTGRRVIALDSDAELLAALRERAECAELDLHAVGADARSFALAAQEPIALCVVPMQTIQLLGGRDGRLAFLRHARAHMRAGGLLACALVIDLEPFDRAEGDPLPTPEETQIDQRRYRSQPVRLQVGTRTIAIERERSIEDTQGIELTRDLIELDRVSATELEQEGIAAGWRPERSRSIEATAEYTGSAVVMLRA